MLSYPQVCCWQFDDKYKKRGNDPRYEGDISGPIGVLEFFRLSLLNNLEVNLKILIEYVIIPDAVFLALSLRNVYFIKESAPFQPLGFAELSSMNQQIMEDYLGCRQIRQMKYGMPS